MNKNPYDVLGVSPDATDDEIKKAYRELSRKYHPDANVDNPLKDLAEEKFKEVQEAYDTIVKEREMVVVIIMDMGMPEVILQEAVAMEIVAMAVRAARLV